MKLKRFFALVLCAVMALSTFGVCAISANAASAFNPVWPTQSYDVSALDIYYSGGSHNGIDIAVGNYGNTQDVYAVASGKVEATRIGCSHVSQGAGHACNGDTWGNYVKISHNVNGTVYYSVYAHLSNNSITVKPGQTVSAGQKIAQMGSSGGSTGYHLHLEVYTGNRTSNNARSFDYYKNNSSIFTKIRFRAGLANSPAYGAWIKNSFSKNGDWYSYNGSGTTAATAQKPTVNVTSYPTSITEGYSFGLRGSVAANGSTTTVTSTIIGPKNYTATDTIGANSTGDIKNMNANNQLLFNNLPAGTYTLTISAKNSGGTTTFSKQFTVTPKLVKPTVNVTSYPTSLKKGSCFGLRGSVISNGTTTTVTSTIRGAKNYTATDTIGANSTGDIRYMNANKNLLFNNLPKGTYTLTISATNSAGTTSWSRSFTVY